MLRLSPQDGATRLLLIRHLEPDRSVHGRAYGSLDAPLSALALEQAAKLAQALESVRLDAVYSSPLRRALETATPLAVHRKLVPIVHEGFREIDFGEIEGSRYEEIEESSPGLFQSWMSDPTGVTFPGGESFAELRLRVLAAAEEIRERHRGSAVALVAHAGVTRTIVAASLSMPDEALFRLDQAYGAVSVIDWLGETPILRVLNASVF
jgi:ribonuclease H / adenosylcobalamin/alpha-ribazole phosphatase